MPSRPSACGGSAGASGVSSRCEDVDLEVAYGERRAILGPNGAGKTTLFNVISGDLPASSGSVEMLGATSRELPARKCARIGLARTYQQSRILGGLTVEDSIYLAVLGVGGGHLRPVTLPRKDRAIRDRARVAAQRVAIEQRLESKVGDLSHGEQRQVGTRDGARRGAQDPHARRAGRGALTR